MSGAFDSLDSALQTATGDVFGAIKPSNVVSNLLAGTQVQIKTNVTRPVLVGGLSSNTGVVDSAGRPVQDTSPGALAAIGLKYSIALLDASGNEITHIGDPPSTDYVILTAYLVALAGLGYIFYRGVRSLF